VCIQDHQRVFSRLYRHLGGYHCAIFIVGDASNGHWSKGERDKRLGRDLRMPGRGRQGVDGNEVRGRKPFCEQVTANANVRSVSVWRWSLTVSVEVFACERIA
jgi:hypothetical protein